jgi:hypothetical protein
MAGTEELGDMGDAMRSIAAQAQELWGRFAEEVDLERRMRETPMAVLAVAAATGFVLGGGLWPVLRPFVKAAARAAASPTNLLALGAALGALRVSGAGVGAGDVATAPSPAGGSGAH